MKQEKERNWHLVRNNNGEWISNEHVVFMTGSSTQIYKSLAEQYGLPLSPQAHYGSFMWCYKHEIEAIDEAHRHEPSYQKQQYYNTNSCNLFNFVKNITKMTHSEFKEKAREHQIRFKEMELGISSERSPKRTLKWKDKDGVEHQREIVVKSSLWKKGSIDKEGNYLIFYPGFRKEITEAVKSSKVTSAQMTTNLLRSEHIPYNIFFPMQHDLEGAKVLFNHILEENRISSVNQIKIEYNPGGLEDGTAFDVYVEYLTSDNKRGGIGIEVKYTEKEYQIKKGSKEWNETHDENGLFHLAPNYRKPSVDCKWFKDVFIANAGSKTTKHVVADKFRQIWRNHLLGAAMKLNGDLDEFTSLTVYPEGNVHFKEVLPEYETMLTDAGKGTFKHTTYEELFSLLEQSFNESKISQLKDWIAYLRRRYIVE